MVSITSVLIFSMLALLFVIALQFYIYSRIDKSNKSIKDDLALTLKNELILNVKDEVVSVVKENIDNYLISQEEMEKRVKEANLNKLKRKNEMEKNQRVERTIENMLSELNRDGISSVIDTERKFHSFGLHDMDFREFKIIYFSFDSLSEMHQKLYENKKDFCNTYKVTVDYKQLSLYMTKYFVDITAIKEMIKNKIKVELGNEVADFLTADSNDEIKKSTFQGVKSTTITNGELEEIKRKLFNKFR